MLDKSSITELILEKINEAGEIALEGLFPSHLAEGRIWRRALGLPTGYEFSPRTFSTILSRLKNQGLVVKSGNNRRSLWSLTKKGSDLLIDEISGGLPQEDGMMRLVIFDVPESERGKRDLMRTELVACGYNQLQKSVWLGYRPLPESFIKNLDDLKLKDKVEIFSVNKRGTLS